MEDLSSNTTLSHYRIIAKIGAGGMGEVYLAEDTKLDRRVALKILPAQFAADRDRMNRFVREAKAASALNHPNILTVYEFGFDAGIHFLATELVEGKTLREMIRSDLSMADALDVAEQTAFALSAAHDNGIVHRDLKPENLMIRYDRIVKVLDFGLVKLTERKEAASDPEAETRALVKTSPHVVLGTANYMSPEQARGKHTDGRTDIWSLGVVLYEMTTGGKLPFVGATTTDVIASIIKSEPPLLAHFMTDIPPDLEKIVGKCLRKNADDRYQSMKDLQIDLRDLRQELQLQIKLERSAAPTRVQRTDQTKDSSEPKTTADAPTAVSTKETAANAANLFKRHRAAFVIALSLVILVAAGLRYLFFTDRTSATEKIESIAVIPFENATGNMDTEYLSDGISETLINSLTELQQLKVIARSTAFRYKGKEIDPKTIGRELQVRAVLMGKVRQMEDRLNVQVDLVDTSTGAQLWGQDYERKVEDILTVKQAIAREVTEKLRLKLSGEQQQQLVKHDTTNAQAYRLYLQGRYYWNKRTSDGIKKAIEHFQQAIDHDPNYALGYVGLADSFLLLAAYAGLPSSETLPKARAAADKALQIDQSLAEAHTSLAEIHLRQWRWAEAEQEFRRAITLNPNYPTAHHWFSIHWRVKGQYDEALKESKRAQELDPLSLIINSNLAQAYYLNNDIDSAIKQSQKVLDLDPRFPNAHHDLGWVYLKQRRDELAIAEFQKAVDFSGRSSAYLSSLGYGYAVTGRRGEAVQIMSELEGRYDKRAALGIHLAGVWAGLGDKDKSFAWLEKDFEQRSGVLPEVRWWNNFEHLRSDQRYADLLRRMGLEP